MKVVLRRALAAAALLPLLPLSGACVDNESSLFVRQVQAITGEDCVVDSSPSALSLSSGILDARFAQEYFAFLLVGNQIVARGSTDQVRTETSKIQLFEYDVRILNSEGAIIGEYTAPCSGFVDQKAGDAEGFGLAGTILIDATTAAALGGAATATGVVQEVVSAVIVRGRTLGGNEIETGEFLFPISVCHGCLVSFPPSANDPDLPYLCDATEDPDPVCNLGQDGPVDCRICQNFQGDQDFCNPVVD